MPRIGFAARFARSGRGLPGRLELCVLRGGKLWGRVLGGVPFPVPAFVRLERVELDCVGSRKWWAGSGRGKGRVEVCLISKWNCR